MFLHYCKYLICLQMDGTISLKMVGLSVVLPLWGWLSPTDEIWVHSPNPIDLHGVALSGLESLWSRTYPKLWMVHINRMWLWCSQICEKAVSAGADLHAILKPQGSCYLVCSSSTEPSAWSRPWMSVLPASLAKSSEDINGHHHHWLVWVYAVQTTRKTPSGNSLPA